MSRRGLTVVRLDGGDAPLAAGLAALARRELRASAFATPGELEAALAGDEADVLWLPPWACVDDALLAAVAAFREAARGGALRVARARLRLRVARAAIDLPEPHVLLSTPGAARLDGERPVPGPGAALDELPAPLVLDLPATLAEHVAAMNEQTSLAARLRDASGAAASWRDLTVRPAGFLVRALAAVHGSRREALPRIVIEAYRQVLVGAKLWERALERRAAA